MIVVEKNEGPKISYEIMGTRLFIDDALMLNLEKYQQDEAVSIDVCRDNAGNLITGVVPGVAEAYVAQVEVPAREYEFVPVLAETAAEKEAETMQIETEKRPLPFNMDACTLILWAVEEV